MDFKDISCVSAESSDAILNGVVYVTPMKKARKKESRGDTMYFDGTISDDTGKLRVYGHDSSARDKLSAIIDKSCGKGVVLQHCEVKQGQGNYEVIIILCIQLN